MHGARKSQDASFWDKKAQGYAKSAIADMDAYRTTLACVRRHLRGEDRVLELGCGTGMTAVELAPSAGSYIASDISAEMTSIGREKADAEGCTNIEFMAASVSSALRDEAKFDVILAFNLLHLLEDLPAVLGEIHSALKPGGLFISKTFCVPDSFSLKVSAIRAILPLMKLVGQAPKHVDFRSVSQLDELITGSGFEIIEQGAYPEHPPRRFLVTRKGA